MMDIEGEATTMNVLIDRTALIGKLKKIYPYADERFITEKANRLCRCDCALRTNLHEWLSGKPFSSVYIHNKYTLGMVLGIRGYDGTGADFVEAFISLNDYAADKSTEINLWRTRL